MDGVSGKGREAEPYYEGISKLPESIRKQAYEVISRISGGEYRSAEEKSREILKKYDDSESGEIRALLADAESAQGKYKEAAKRYEEIIREFPENEVFRMTLAVNYTAMKKYGKAQKVFEEVRVIPASFEAFTENYCVLLNQTGQQEKKAGVIRKALHDWEKAKLSPQDSDVYFPYYAYPKLMEAEIENEDRKETVEVMHELEKYIDSDPDASKAEHVFAQAISLLSETANEESWSRAVFRDFLDYLSTKDIFHKQSCIISSGYVSIESYDFYESSKSSLPMRMIYGLWQAADSVLYNYEKEDGEEILRQMRNDSLDLIWGHAKLAQEYPEDVKKAMNQYPRYWARCGLLLDDGSHDWAKIMKKAVAKEMKETYKSQESVERVWNLRYSRFKKSSRKAFMRRD